VLVQKIDAIGAQALEHALDGQHDMLRAAVEPRTPFAGFEIDVPAELGSDHDLVTERRNDFAENPFHLMRAVSLSRIEKGDAMIKGCPDDVEHLGSGRDRGLIGAAHVLHANPDAGDFQGAEPASGAEHGLRRCVGDRRALVLRLRDDARQQ
jgi:hypothetical protein